MPKEGMLIQMDTSIHDWFGIEERDTHRYREHVRRYA